ncbi:DUF2855 family protein [Gilvimarinus sp. F26214L]|uniref:DUF2855 family protein n=1 Tax=Gilvimarinus sp. DZF01 TaxID=3461371 RepID=UPI004046388D
MSVITQLQTNKSALDQTRVIEQPRPTLADGEALLRIDRLAVTTNNITYASFGDTPHLRYWDFFPTGESGWGHMPAWGFAEVIASTVEGVNPGERYYGFWPIASHLVMQPVRVSERGFYDGTPHRLELTSAYNQYQRVTTDAAYRAKDEDYQMLLRPLFITSWMLADYLQDNDFFGAQQIVVSSASSKTAYGTAFALEAYPGCEVVAVTSTGNQAFVDSLGCYNHSITYEQLTELDASIPTLYVDFSGDRALREKIHDHFDAQLVHDCFAGAAQTQEHPSEVDAPAKGPAPKPYFAPYQIRKRNADWGAAEVTRRFNEAQLAFIRRVSDPANPWMQIEQHDGFNAAQQLVSDLVNGRVDPKLGHVVLLDPGA